MKLSDQGAEVICDTILKILENNGIVNAFLQHNLIGFGYNGASVILGKTSSVGTSLKSKFSNLLLWHCLNHRIDLAVGDSVKAVDSFYDIQDLFDKIYYYFLFLYLYALTHNLQNFNVNYNESPLNCKFK